jgi:hypothetical protein
MKIWLHKVPPYAFLDDFDLRPYGFRAGQVYEMDRPLGEVLVASGYAIAEMRRNVRTRAVLDSSATELLDGTKTRPKNLLRGMRGRFRDVAADTAHSRPSRRKLR